MANRLLLTTFLLLAVISAGTLQNTGPKSKTSTTNTPKTNSKSVTAYRIQSGSADVAPGGVKGGVYTVYSSDVKNWNCRTGPLIGQGRITAVGNGYVDVGTRRLKFAPCSRRVYSKNPQNFTLGEEVKYSAFVDGQDFWAQQVIVDNGMTELIFPTVNKTVTPQPIQARTPSKNPI